jgi:ribose 5-phosphate isomerase B
MKIAIGSDHAGFVLKQKIKDYLLQKNIEVLDEGTIDDHSVDYPDFAKAVCSEVVTRDVDKGILVCFTGIGMSITANKFRGIRAALVGSVENARLSREHNNANVLCLAAKDTAIELALEIVETFVNTEFAGGRHQRRVDKIKEIEEEQDGRQGCNF